LEAVCGILSPLQGFPPQFRFPGAYAPGFILAPLRGWTRGCVPIFSKRISC
jgi:hypothetical protein